MSSELIAAFSPNDFFFVKAEQGLLDRPMPTNCDTVLKKPAENCSTNAGPCVDLELCKNQNNANTLYAVQNRYGGSDQRYADVKKVYNDTLFNSFNLGIGIIVATGFIYSKYIYNIKTI
uniref:Uncharacterized protein n=1 Tax=viral metagenome TaxID=1070528 RepID=A0A6C0B8B1_9ZZZZ